MVLTPGGINVMDPLNQVVNPHPSSQEMNASHTVVPDPTAALLDDSHEPDPTVAAFGDIMPTPIHQPHVHTGHLDHTEILAQRPDEAHEEEEQDEKQPAKPVKSRKSFSLREKYSVVSAFLEDCKAREKQENQGLRSKKSKKSMKRKRGSKSLPTQSGKTNDFTSRAKKLKSWLNGVNERDELGLGHLSYQTIYKWVQNYSETVTKQNDDSGLNVDDKKKNVNSTWKMGKASVNGDFSSDYTSIGDFKKVRSRPYQELENILVAYLKVRNENLRKRGLRPSSVQFIKERANLFYRDMYTDGTDDNMAYSIGANANGANAQKEFKCSNGWVHRFKKRYKHILEPSEEDRDGNEIQPTINEVSPLVPATDTTVPQQHVQQVEHLPQPPPTHPQYHQHQFHLGHVNTDLQMPPNDDLLQHIQPLMDNVVDSHVLQEGNHQLNPYPHQLLQHHEQIHHAKPSHLNPQHIQNDYSRVDV